MAEVQTTFQDADANGKTIKIISFAGQLDETNVDEEAKKIYQVIDEMADPNLILDFSQLAYMNSKSIGYVTDWYSRVSAKNGKIAISSPRPNILDILKVVGITQIITIHENLDEAKLTFGGAATEAAPASPTATEAPAETPVAETPEVPDTTATPAPVAAAPAETPVAETPEVPVEPSSAEPSSAEATEVPATEAKEPTEEPSPVAAAPAPEAPVEPTTPPAPAEGGEPVEAETPAETPPPATPPAA